MFKDIVVKRFNYLRLSITKWWRVSLPIAFILGCLLATNGIFSIERLIVALFIIFFINRKVFIVAILLLAGVLYTRQFINVEEHVRNYVNQDVKVSGTIQSYPSKKNSRFVLLLKPDYLLINQEIIKINAGLIQFKQPSYVKYTKGDYIQANMFLKQPENFDTFDYVEYLKSNNIYAIGEKVYIINHEPSSNKTERPIVVLRDKVVTKINKQYFDPHSKLIAGMLLGTREEFQKDFATDLSTTGTTHIIAVSGYNISLIINFILKFAGVINRRTLLKLSYIGLIIFIMLVGADNIPALRATLMGFVLIYGMFKGKKGQGFFILCIVAAVIHLQNPYTYKSLSFQLSFISTAGLMLLSSKIEKLFPKGLGDLTTTLTAILSTFPVTFSNFGTFSTYALPANIVIAPLVPLVSLFGFLWLLIPEQLKIISVAVRFILWGIIELMVEIVRFFSSLPFSTVSSTENLSLISLGVLVMLVIAIFEFSYRDYIKLND